MSLPAVSKHLKVLERAGLISRGRDGQFRPCRLEAERLDLATDWIEENGRSGPTASTSTAPDALLGSDRRQHAADLTHGAALLAPAFADGGHCRP